ncbi:hypothetical protein Z945_2757 [Sulfitobacter noctilucae]|nr:hypothetical protein Z945_2757 [Sulfitobacter noctilucae]
MSFLPYSPFRADFYGFSQDAVNSPFSQALVKAERRVT